jgi:hypothetical protein
MTSMLHCCTSDLKRRPEMEFQIEVNGERICTGNIGLDPTFVSPRAICARSPGGARRMEELTAAFETCRMRIRGFRSIGNSRVCELLHTAP